VKLLARLRRALWPQARNAGQLVVLAHGVHTMTPLMMAALHENWNIRFAQSSGDAIARIRKAASVALIYDWDSHKSDWHAVCTACVQSGVPFYLVASSPSDDLFLAVAGAGGSGVLWKPLRAEQTVAAIVSVRSLAAPAPASASGMEPTRPSGRRGDAIKSTWS
jgi:hypothetical protein